MLLKIICFVVLVAWPRALAYGHSDETDGAYRGEDNGDSFGGYQQDDDDDAGTVRVRRFESKTVKTLSPQEILEVRGAINQILSGHVNPFTPLSVQRSAPHHVHKPRRAPTNPNQPLADKTKEYAEVTDDTPPETQTTNEPTLLTEPFKTSTFTTKEDYDGELSSDFQSTVNSFASLPAFPGTDYITTSEITTITMNEIVTDDVTGRTTETNDYVTETNTGLTGATMNAMPLTTAAVTQHTVDVKSEINSILGRGTDQDVESNKNQFESVTTGDTASAPPARSGPAGMLRDESTVSIEVTAPPAEQNLPEAVDPISNAHLTNEDGYLPATSTYPTRSHKFHTSSEEELAEKEDATTHAVASEEEGGEKGETIAHAVATEEEGGEKGETIAHAVATEKEGGEKGDTTKQIVSNDKDDSGESADEPEQSETTRKSRDKNKNKYKNKNKIASTEEDQYEDYEEEMTTTRRRRTRTKSRFREKTALAVSRSTGRYLVPWWPTERTTRTTTTQFKLDVPALLAIIANLTHDYEVNLTQNLNQTLMKYSVPTCETPTTTVKRGLFIDYDANATGTIVAKCFVCGLEVDKIPRNAHCADAFAGDFLPLVPVDMTARGKMSKYRKYCRYADVPHYITNSSQPRSVFGRWTGGCSVRWIDLSGVYTQRSCRNRAHAIMGRHFASKRMAKLEMALSNVENGCITSPMATLVPLSRGISLYARFHACVCTGSWCNAADIRIPWTEGILLLLLASCCSPHF